MQLTDHEREELIDTCAMLMQGAASPSVRRYWWSMLQNLKHERTPEQIARLAREEKAA
jgi:hypothetical protein